MRQGNDTKLDTHRSLGNGRHRMQCGAQGSRALRAGCGGPGVAGRGRVWQRPGRGRGLHSAERAATPPRATGCQGSWEEEWRPS